MCVTLVFKENTRIVATIKLQRYVTHTGVFEIVVSKLHHWEETCLVILFLIHKNTKINFHDAVLLFCLIVCLRVKRNRESSLNVKKITEQEPKLGRKNRFPVTYDGVREAVMSYSHVYDYFR